MVDAFTKVTARLVGTIAYLMLCMPYVPASAQPSGGPYGPIQQTYSVPKGAGRV